MALRLAVVSQREPSVEGRGDEHRAAQIVRSLSSFGIDVQSFHVLKSQGTPIPVTPRQIASFIRSSLSAPISIARVGACGDEQVLDGFDLAILVTSRVALSTKGTTKVIIDFVDDLATNYERRAEIVRSPLRPAIRWESRRQRRFDGQLARETVAGVAVTAGDAATLGVEHVIPLYIE